MMRENKVDPWFARAIAIGLTRMAALQLPGTPIDTQTAAMMKDVWVDTLWVARQWDEELDARRIEAAFRALATRCTRFAAPAQFLEMLPPRMASVEKLPELSLEQRSAQNARVHALLMAVIKRIDGGKDAPRKG